MKYGMRERLSGAVILIALGVIFVPMLFDEPAPRDEPPEPALTIEEPVEVERQDVPDPEPPSSLGEIRFPSGTASQTPELVVEEAATQASVTVTSGESAASAPDSPSITPPPSDEAPDSDPPANDPIAELARAADQRLSQDEPGADESEAANTTAATASGGWAVQVGSFGQPDNAERLQSQLNEQGFSAFSRPRDNDLTTVYVGPFESSEAGEQAMGELKEQANLQGLLVRVRD
ncbi:SPOR domain-containing protein [Halomonas sp. TRM85114]|uniref:SPOR domain-containing protein n=1 Tax=Halomonas jincaotanensis TaxID=2810616 RepID=UPI001BD45A9E|nr:SPOR domain-containing protein [Halomonas jincaotanensis]MBS9404221.1 SPOR domain-containing protein [Halomonas jincaotanensis]